MTVIEQTPIAYDCSPHFISGGVVDSYSLQGAPAWLSIDNAGMLTGDADVEAVSNVTVTAHNADGTAVSNVFEVNASEASVTPVFIAASYDPDTFELKQEVLGVGGETCIHGGILSPDKDGIYHAIPANTPVWKGFREDAGKYYADDGAGVLLDPLPWMHYQKAMTNINPRAIELALWSAVNAAVSYVTGMADDAGNAALVNGTATGQYAIQTISWSIPQNNYLGMIIYVKKDANQSRFPLFQLWADGNTERLVAAYLNTETGETTVRPDISLSPNYNVESIDVGLWWKVIMRAKKHYPTSSTTTLAITPASSSDISDPDNPVSTTGSIIVGSCEVYNNPSLADLRAVLPIRTTGSHITKDEIVSKWAAANHDDIGKYSLDIDYQGGDASVLSMGGVDVLSTMTDEEGELITGTEDGYLDIGQTNCNPATAHATAKTTTFIDVSGMAALELNYSNGADRSRYQFRTAGVCTAVVAIVEMSVPASPYLLDIPAGTEEVRFYYTVADGGALSVKEVLNTQSLKLSDGTNTAQLPITEGEHHIEANFSGSNLILDLDGVTNTVPYDGSLGSGDISVGVDIKRLERV